MQQKTLNILIADSDDNFRNKLREILYDLQLEMPDVKYNIMATGSMDELKTVFDTVPVDLAFIDYFFFNEKPDKIEPVLKNLKMKCQLVMLIPPDINENIYEILESIDLYDNLQLSGHILKENYTTDLVRVLAKVFIKKVIS